MTEARPRLYTRPVLLLAIVALLASMAPAAAQAQSTAWGSETACPSSAVPDSGFSDATGPHGHNIDCLAWFALTTGRTATSYATQDDVRRDQTASFVVRVLERLVPSGFVMPSRDVGAFSDVDGGPHRGNIETLAGFDPPVVAGYRDGTYRPRLPLTRAQFASITVRALDHLAEQDLIDPLPAASSPFDDTDGSVHEANIARLARAGIVQGKDRDTYDPQGAITRGQTASVLARLLGGLVDEGLIEHPREFSGVIHDGTDTAPGEIGDPIANATIRATGFTEVADRTDSQGRYSIRLQQPSEYTLELTAAGFAPQRHDLILPEADAETNFAMYPQATAPTAAVPAPETDAADVTITSDDMYWHVDLPFDARAANEVRLEFPQGLVVSLGESQAADLFLSRHPDGTSDRIGADSGTHTLYYDMGEAWLTVEAEFDEFGTLVAINGDPYDDPDADN